MNQFLLTLVTCGWLFSAASAQDKPVKLPGIPFPLSWENTPLHYSVSESVLTIEAGAKTDMAFWPNHRRVRITR